MHGLRGQRILKSMHRVVRRKLVIIEKKPTHGFKALIGVRSELARWYQPATSISRPTETFAYLPSRAPGPRPSRWSWPANSHRVSRRQQNRLRLAPNRGLRNFDRARPSKRFPRRQRNAACIVPFSRSPDGALARLADCRMRERRTMASSGSGRERF
jgi:hypothetical protein